MIERMKEIILQTAFAHEYRVLRPVEDPCLYQAECSCGWTSFAYSDRYFCCSDADIHYRSWCNFATKWAEYDDHD